MTRKCFIFLFLIFNSVFIECYGQISYPDSCLKLGFYYRDKNSRLTSTKTIYLKNSEISKYFGEFGGLYSNHLSLFVLFKNMCNQKITIPSMILLDMPGQDDFTIEGYKINANGLDTLQFNVEFDYHVRAHDVIIQPKKSKIIPYPITLGFPITKKGTYKFRLRFYTGYNYIPVDDYKYYFSNWIYLNIK